MESESKLNWKPEAKEARPPYASFLRGFFKELEESYELLKKDKDIDAEALFKTFQDDKIASLKEIVDDIRDLIAERQRLNKEIFMDIEKAKLAIGNQITDPALTDEDRTKLRISLIELDQKKTAEKLAAFRDISDLRKELREHLKEYQDKSKRLDLLERLV